MREKFLHYTLRVYSKVTGENVVRMFGKYYIVYGKIVKKVLN